MDRRVRRILELVQQHVAARIGGGQLLGRGDGTSHPLGTGGENELGAEGRQHLASLNAHGLGHGQGDGDSPCGRDEGQGDAGVAAGRLDDLLAGAEQPLLFGVPDHRCADAALDRVGRVAPLYLTEDCGTFGDDAVQAYQRGAADGK